MKLLWSFMLAGALSCTLAVSAGAQDRDRDDQNRQMNQDRDHDRDHDQNGNKWQSRNGWEYRTYDRDDRPQGWSQGQRTDWRNCDDGTRGRQYDCYNYEYQGQPYYYYRDENGRTIVRRQHHNNGDHDKDRDDRKDHDRDRDHD